MNLIESVRGWLGTPRAELTNSKDLESVLIADGAASFTGVTVTPEVALMVAGVSAATSLLAETVAQIPLNVYERTPDGGKGRAVNNPLWGLLHNQPNNWQNSFEFRELLSMHLLLWGNCYAFINRRATGVSRGEITELLPIHPDRVKVEQDENYVVTYRIAIADGEQIVLPRDRVFHIRDRSFDGITGRSRLKSGRDSIGLARVTERWGAQLFGNGARPSGILKTDQRLNQEQFDRIRQSWKAAHGGENALGTAVLDNGFDFKAMAMTNDEAQFLETRKFQLVEIARIFRIPPHMLADLERSTFSNIEHQSLEFVKYSLMPWLRRWENAINTQLLDPSGDVFAEFLVDGLLRGDLKSRYEAYAIAKQNKWMNTNEIRERENMNPIDGGDVFENPAITPGNENGGDNEPE